MKLESYVNGRWHAGRGVTAELCNPATDEILAQVSTEGIDFAAALDFARTEGGPTLRELTFSKRSELLSAMYEALYAHREELLDLSIRSGGNTRSDARFDVDGAYSALLAYIDHGRQLGGQTVLLDGDSEQLGRTPRYGGLHVLTPLQGVAVHINAYNFPAWGFAEKAAVALLAGMPVVSKPATSTAILAHRMMEIIVDDGALPEGVLSFVAGPVGDLLDHLGPQDVLAFTGSGDTASRLRRIDAHTVDSVRVNVEADSLNAAILGPDVELGGDTWHLMLDEVTTDVRQKAGQKCTAIRRVLVPTERLEDCVGALEERLTGVVVGNPADPSVDMGPLVNPAQLEDVRSGVEAIATEATRVCGEAGPSDLVGVEEGHGNFVTPFLFRCADAGSATVVHEREVFGPVVTVMGYGSAEEAAAFCARGGGALVSSVYSDDRSFARDMLVRLAPHHGRLTLGSAKVAEISPGPGTVLPELVHGGPGRAGGGEELGGLRGLSFYLQRTAIQGYRPLIERFFPAT